VTGPVVDELDPATVQGLVARAGDPKRERWLRQVRRTGACRHPVRVRGVVLRGDELVYSTASEPDGALMVRCGNRRAECCPSCAMDMDGSRGPFTEVLEKVDTPAERARLVRAVHGLLGEGHVDVIAAAAAAYELSTDSRKLFSHWLTEAVAHSMSELVAETMLSDAHNDSAEHERDAGSG
jgi:hypothetical protein